MTQPSSPFKPGDVIVSLPDLCARSGAVTGAMSAGLVLGRVHTSWLIIIAGALAGGIGGFFIGRALGALLFSASAGDVRVVRVGRDALPLTLRAAFVPAVLVGVGAAVITAMAIGVALWPAAVVSGLVVAVAIGLLFGLGSALK